MTVIVDRLKEALAHPDASLAETLLAELRQEPLENPLDQSLILDRLELAVWGKRWQPDPDLEVVGGAIYRFLLLKRLGLSLGIEELEAIAKDVAKRARQAMGEMPATPFLPPSVQPVSIASELRQLCRLEGWEAGWSLYREDGSDPECWRQLLFRAGQAVVDVGLHAGNLRPAEAPAVYVERLNMPIEWAKQEVERQISQPTVAATPLLVYLQLLELRAQQQQALGEAFSRPAFDAQVLAHGPVPVSRIRDLLA